MKQEELFGLEQIHWDFPGWVSASLTLFINIMKVCFCTETCNYCSEN